MSLKKLFIIIICLVAASAFAQQDFSKVQIDEIVAAKPSADYDAKWGRGFLKPDQWVQIVYSVMQK